MQKLEPTPLIADRVAEIFKDALATQEELDNQKAVIADVLIGRVGLVMERIEPHREEIGGMLKQLPDEFQKDGGQGGSFLNACYDKHGRQWTGLHARMAELFALGMVTEQVTMPLPREMWGALPGGMPYYTVV